MSHSKQDRIDDTKLFIFMRDQWRCCHIDKHGRRCLQSASECAHEIGQGHINGIITLWNQTYKEQRNYTWIEIHVIHNTLNMKSSCRAHNSNFNIGFNPGAVRDKLNEIRAQLKKDGIIK